MIKKKLYMYRSGFSVLLLTIIVCAVGVALALSALSSSTQVARTNVDTVNAATDESQARNCTEKVLAKLRLYKFYGGDETFSTEKCRVYTVTGTGIGTASVTAGSLTTVNGIGTQFTVDFAVGDIIAISGQPLRTISAIGSNTSLTVNLAYTAAVSSTTYGIPKPRTDNGTRLIQVKRGNKILETKIIQINPKIIIEYQKFVTSAFLDSNNPYIIDPLALRLWLKADRAESNNAQPVISIKNATDDIITFAQVSTTPTLAPTLITNAINNKPALRFDGIDDFLTGTATSIGNTTGLTVIVIGKSNSALTNQTYISKFNAPNNKREWRLQNDNFIATDLATAEQVSETVSFTNNTNTRILTARWAPSTASSININNTAAINATASFTNITSTDTPIIVGGQQQGGSVSGLFKGDIAEILVYQKRLSDAELNAINSYLNNKYRVY
jgi:hypothetical protein